MSKTKTVIIIGGPTASGKTALSLQLAAHFNTSIISADSRQCFRELNIGVAKPPNEALESIKHYFINSHSIHDTVNAQVFEQYALNAVNEIFLENDIAIMVGGTGMYIKAFCEGLDKIPETDSAIRKEIIDNYNNKGLEWLQKEIQEKDVQFWLQAEQKNPQRLMRALEVKLSTGKSIKYFRQNNKYERDFKIIKLSLRLSKEQLHDTINKRIETMINMGLIEEVALLKNFKNTNALQTVGYREVFDYLEGIVAFEKAIENIKIHTRQYAKRQITWFKKHNFVNLNIENKPLEIVLTILKP